jgi:hypothetical protein
MLRSVKDIQGYVLGAQDGEIGRCSDFLFDDKHWTVRYIVADTHKWLPGRKVLISPISIGEADGTTRTLNVGLTKDQITNSPPLDADAPVSRQYEIAFNQYFDWAHYWGGASVWGSHPYPRLLNRAEVDRRVPENTDNDPNLRSTKEVAGYHIQATDTDIGSHRGFYRGPGLLDHPVSGNRYQQLAARQQEGIGRTRLGRPGRLEAKQGPDGSDQQPDQEQS